MRACAGRHRQPPQLEGGCSEGPAWRLLGRQWQGAECRPPVRTRHAWLVALPLAVARGWGRRTEWRGEAARGCGGWGRGTRVAGRGAWGGASLQCETGRWPLVGHAAACRHPVLEGRVQLLAGGALGREVLGAQPQLVAPLPLRLVEQPREARQPVEREVLAAAEAVRRERRAQRREARRAAARLDHLLLHLELRLERLRLLEPMHLLAHLLVGAVVQPLELGLALPFGARVELEFDQRMAGGLGLALLRPREQQQLAHLVVALLELLHRPRLVWLGADEAVVDDRPAQVKAAAQVEELVGLGLLPAGPRQVLGVLLVGVAEHLDRLVEAGERVLGRFVIVLAPVAQSQPVGAAAVVELLKLPSDHARALLLEQRVGLPGRGRERERRVALLDVLVEQRKDLPAHADGLLHDLLRRPRAGSRRGVARDAKDIFDVHGGVWGGHGSRRCCWRRCARASRFLRVRQFRWLYPSADALFRGRGMRT